MEYGGSRRNAEFKGAAESAGGGWLRITGADGSGGGSALLLPEMLVAAVMGWLAGDRGSGCAVAVRIEADGATKRPNQPESEGREADGTEP